MAIFWKAFWKKNKSKIILAVVIAILTGAVAFLWNRMNHYIDECHAKDTIIYTQTHDYYTKDSVHVIETTQQQMSLNEYKSKDSLNARKIEAMGVKMKRLESLVSFNYTAGNSFTPHKEICDTVLWLNGYDTLFFDTVKVEKESYNDGYLIYSRIQVADKPSLVKYTYTDSLIAAASVYHKIKHCPGLLPKLREKIGRKLDVKLDASFANKNAIIKDIKYIKIIK